MLININKYIAQSGLASRRGADELIKAGRVKINGNVAKPIDKVRETDQVFVDEKKIQAENKKYYLAFNKPVGVISTMDPNSPNNIMDYVQFPARVFPVGRLDVNSQGLILLTNDGDLAQKIMKGKNIEKEYLVYVDKNLDEATVVGLSNGSIKLDGYSVLPANVEKLTSRSFKMIIKEGRNRQIRRMCEAFRLNVTRLTRVRIGNIELDAIPEGKYIEISTDKIENLLTEKH